MPRVWFTRPQLGARGPGPGARAATLKLEFESWQSCVACDRPAAGASLATVTGSIAEAANRGPITSSRVHTRARAHTHGALQSSCLPRCQFGTIGAADIAANYNEHHSL
jgi:hypothetical protein